MLISAWWRGQRSRHGSVLLSKLTSFVELTSMLILRLRLRCCSLLLQSVLGAVSAFGQHLPVTVRLTKWFYATRLETRTKESNVRASVPVEKPIRVMKVTGANRKGQHRPTWILGERFA